MHAKFLLYGRCRQATDRVGRVLVGAGYTSVGHVAEPMSLLQSIRSLEPDLIVLDLQDGFHEIESILLSIEEAWLAALVLMTGTRSREIDRFLEKSVITSWLQKPLQEDSILPIVSQCLKTFRLLAAHQREIIRLRRSMDERRMLEKAKWILGHIQELSEEEAYEVIRKKSRATRQSMGKIAEAIVLAAEFSIRGNP